MPHKRDKSQTPAASPQAALWRTMTDTTWRMLTPSVVLVGLGMYVDISYGTKPWLTITGVICGLVVSAFLIKQQLETKS